MGIRVKVGYGLCICSFGVKGLVGVYNRFVKFGELLLGVYIWVLVYLFFLDIMLGLVFIVIYFRWG